MSCLFARTKFRSQRGSLAGIMVATLILITVVLGALAVDFFHMHTVQTELQNATDAASLAGAQDLYVNPDLIQIHALETAAKNSADGHAVSVNSPDTTVAVQVSQPEESGSTGQVQVTAAMKVNHLFAPIVNRFSDTVTASSIAARNYTINRVLPTRCFR